MEETLEFNDYLLYLSDLDLNTCDEDARLDLWDFLDRKYQQWWHGITNSEAHMSPFVLKIFPPERMGTQQTECVQLTESLREKIRTCDNLLVRVQCVCSYYRFLALRYIMFDLNEVSLGRKEEIDRYIMFDLNEVSRGRTEDIDLLLALEHLLCTPDEEAFKILPFLAYLYVAMMSLVVIIGNLPIINHEYQSLLKTLEDQGKIIRRLLGSVQNVRVTPAIDAVTNALATLLQDPVEGEVDTLLKVANQHFSSVNDIADSSQLQKGFWYPQHQGGQLPVGHELTVIVAILKYRLQLSSRLALGVYGSSEVGGIGDSLRDEGMNNRSISLRDFPYGVLLPYRSTLRTTLNTTAQAELLLGNREIAAGEWSLPNCGIIDSELFVIFRGSDGLSFSDWTVNLSCLPYYGTIVYKGIPLLSQWMHLGFFHRARFLVPRIIEEIEAYFHREAGKYVNTTVEVLAHTVRVSICGHSQGAALATILAHCVDAYFRCEGRVRADRVRLDLSRVRSALNRLVDAVSHQLNDDGFRQSIVDVLPLDDFEEILRREGTSDHKWAALSRELVKLRKKIDAAVVQALRRTEPPATKKEIMKAWASFQATVSPSLPILREPVTLTTFANPGAFYFVESNNASTGESFFENSMVRHVTYRVDCDLIPAVGKLVGMRHGATVENQFSFDTIFPNRGFFSRFFSPHAPKTYESFVLEICSANDAWSVVSSIKQVSSSSNGEYWSNWFANYGVLGAIVLSPFLVAVSPLWLGYQLYLVSDLAARDLYNYCCSGDARANT